MFPKTSIKEYLVLRPFFIIIPDSSNINHPPRGTLWHASMSFAVTFAPILLKSSTKFCYGPCRPMAPVGHHGEIIGLWPPSATMGFYFHFQKKNFLILFLFLISFLFFVLISFLFFVLILFLIKKNAMAPVGHHTTLNSIFITSSQLTSYQTTSFIFLLFC